MIEWTDKGLRRVSAGEGGSEEDVGGESAGEECNNDPMSRTDMVRAYTESLLEQFLEVEKLHRDPDGDYPVRFRSAKYYVRVDGGSVDNPVVQVFAIVLAEIDPSAELLEVLNLINTQLRFARAFWVNGQVLIESEMPGDGLSLAGFSNSCITVAEAADHFGPRLAEQFGGKTAFADEQGPDYQRPELSTGLYL